MRYILDYKFLSSSLRIQPPFIHFFTQGETSSKSEKVDTQLNFWIVSVLSRTWLALHKSKCSSSMRDTVTENIIGTARTLISETLERSLTCSLGVWLGFTVSGLDAGVWMLPRPSFSSGTHPACSSSYLMNTVSYLSLCLIQGHRAGHLVIASWTECNRRPNNGSSPSDLPEKMKLSTIKYSG